MFELKTERYAGVNVIAPDKIDTGNKKFVLLGEGLDDKKNIDIEFSDIVGSASNLPNKICAVRETAIVVAPENVSTRAKSFDDFKIEKTAKGDDFARA